MTVMIRPSALVAVALVAAAALVGCRDEEQGRKLVFDKGHYAGTPVVEPSAQALAALRDRVQTQRY
jgi:hypothetical protein